MTKFAQRLFLLAALLIGFSGVIPCTSDCALADSRPAIQEAYSIPVVFLGVFAVHSFFFRVKDMNPTPGEAQGEN